MSSTSTPPEVMTLAAGTLVAGKLRVIRLLGVGGMGTVYEVEHVLTKHHRALKILHPGASARLVERFVREASAAARVGNPHVAEAFDAGTFETGEPYLLMELLEGETLEERLRRTGPLAVGELTDLVGQACEGVQAAHDAGIVHRDLKPENLFVTAREGAPFVKILDFGISKFDEERTGALGITEENSVMGTPWYMSPEQVRASASIDVRTDIYALGVMLYECACGERPYDAQHLTQLAVLIHEGRPVPLEQRRPALPREFCAIVHRAMAADREQRYTSARALADALARFRPSASPYLQPQSPSAGRVVIRPSQRPAAIPNQRSVPPLGGGSIEAALAATLVKESPAGGRRRGLALPALGVAVLVIAAAGLLATARSLRSGPAAGVDPPEEHRAPLVPTTGFAASASPDLAEPDQTLAPLPAPVPCASASAPAAPAHPGTVPPPAPSASQRPAIRSSPTATAAGPSRVDQKGLAGENPFR